jgi:tetratricopeptide (TPR) repeat protein
MKLNKKYILPRRRRPEIFEIEKRLRVRRFVRFMRRYTDMPVGLAVRVDAQLMADVMLVTELYDLEPCGREWCIAAEREQICSIVSEFDLSPDLYEDLAIRVAAGGAVQLLSDDLVATILNTSTDQTFAEEMATLGDIENPHSANEYHIRGHALRDQGEKEAALAAYDRAVEESPDSIAYRRSRALMLEGLGRWAEAAGDWRASCQSAAESNDLVGYLEALHGLCFNSYKLQSVSELVLALEKLVKIAGRITFEAEWNHDGEGSLDDTCHISGLMVVETLSHVLTFSAPEELPVPDRMLMQRLETARNKLLIMRRVYCP